MPEIFKYRSYFLLILFALISNFSVFAQVNTESLRKTSVKTGWFNFAQASVGLNSGNSEFYSVGLLARTDYLFYPFNAFAVCSYEFKRSSEKNIVNKAFAHVRLMRYFSNSFAGELFLQKEFNEFLKVNDRNLAGMNVRLNLVDYTSEIDTMTNLLLYAGVGFMLENENIGSQNSYISNIIRSTNYLNFKWSINSSVNFQSVTYIQISAERLNDFRFTNESALEFFITENVKFFASMKYRFDNEPPLNVKEYDLELNNGIKIEF